MNDAAPDTKPANPAPKPMSRSAKGCLGFAIFVVLLVAIPLLAGKTKPDEQAVPATPASARNEVAKKYPSPQRMARLREVVEAALSEQRQTDKALMETDGGIFSVSWSTQTGDPAPAHKTSVVLNRIPHVLVVRYMDESRLPDGNSGTEIAKVSAIDVVKIIAQVIEGDSQGAITKQSVESTLAGLFVGDWKDRANSYPGKWPNWSVQLQAYKVALSVGRRRGQEAEKDGSAGLFTFHATVYMPLDR